MEAAVHRALRLAFKSDFSIAHVHVETITCRITHVVVSRGEFQGLVFEAGGMMLFESVRSVARWLQPTPTQLNPQRSEQYRGFVRCVFMAKAIEVLPHEGLHKRHTRAGTVPGTCLRGRRKNCGEAHEALHRSVHRSITSQELVEPLRENEIIDHTSCTVSFSIRLSAAVALPSPISFVCSCRSLSS